VETFHAGVSSAPQIVSPFHFHPFHQCTQVSKKKTLLLLLTNENNFLAVSGEAEFLFTEKKGKIFQKVFPLTEI
jgi:hypothetical protein